VPRIAFPGGSFADVKLGSKSQTGAPPIAVPVGPREFPTPEPPPPEPLTVVAAHFGFLGSARCHILTLSRPVILHRSPVGWTINGGVTVTGCGRINADTDSQCRVMLSGAGSTQFTVPEADNAITAADGGIIPAGTYPVT
jgi:hypothetical protein